MTEYLDESTGEVLDLSHSDGVARALLAQQYRIERLTMRLTMATTSLETLQEQLDERDDSLLDGVTAWTWSALGPLGAETLWQRLERWVGWLRGRYPLAEQLPGCWWRHPELVEELTALHVAWRAAYSDPAASMTAPIEWHQHYLPTFLARVRGWGVHCTDSHRDRPVALYSAAGTDDPAAFEQYVADDVQQRRDYAGGGDGALSPSPISTGTGREEQPHMETLPREEMTALLATGQASMLGTIPGAPVTYQNRYWVADGTAYVRVDDDDLNEQLRRDHERLQQADKAVNNSRTDIPAGD